MMDGLRQYVLSVTAAAIAVAILTTLFDRSSGMGKLIRLIGSIILTIVVVAPVVKLEWTPVHLPAVSEQAAEAVQAGQVMAETEKQTIIKQRAEAYILDKAKAMSAGISAEIVLGEDDIPSAVTIRGNISPSAKAQLQRILEIDLGISKENQVWIGQDMGKN